VDKFGQAFATHENCPGSYAARNKGLSLAKGDVLAFTDSDCIPALDWIERAWLIFQGNGIGLVLVKLTFLQKSTTDNCGIL